MDRILHTGDLHFQLKRLDECIRCADFIVKKAKFESVDACIIAGDLYDKTAMNDSPEHLAATVFISDLSRIAPVYMIKGNHDNNALSVFNILSGKNYPIRFFDEIEEVQISIGSGTYHTLMLPYINPALFSSMSLNISDVYTDASDFYFKTIRDFAAKKTDYPKILVGHISVFGAKLANSEKIQSNEVMLKVSEFPDNIMAVMLGHIHNRDQEIFKGTNIMYCGAHYRTNFGERGQPGCVMWDIENGVAIPRIINTPAKEMKEYVLSQSDVKEFSKSGELPFDIDGDSDVKITAEIEEGMSHIFEKDKIKELFNGNGSIQVGVKTIPKIKVRSKNMIKKVGLIDKVVEWCKINNVDFSDSLREKTEKVLSQTEAGYAG